MDDITFTDDELDLLIEVLALLPANHYRYLKSREVIGILAEFGRDRRQELRIKRWDKPQPK